MKSKLIAFLCIIYIWSGCTYLLNDQTKLYFNHKTKSFRIISNQDLYIKKIQIDSFFIYKSYILPEYKIYKFLNKEVSFDSIEKDFTLNYLSIDSSKKEKIVNITIYLDDIYGEYNDNMVFIIVNLDSSATYKRTLW